jgi:hypothetical protein
MLTFLGRSKHDLLFGLHYHAPPAALDAAQVYQAHVSTLPLPVAATSHTNKLLTCIMPMS